jgi:hypothetical protein
VNTGQRIISVARLVRRYPMTATAGFIVGLAVGIGVAVAGIVFW